MPLDCHADFTTATSTNSASSKHQFSFPSTAPISVSISDHHHPFKNIRYLKKVWCY